MKVELNPPPRGVFTYEDEVSGRVVFDTIHTTAIGFIYVYFHGWVNTRVYKTNSSQGGQGVSTTETIDKETLFQLDQKVYEGHDRIPKNTHYEWPFRFDFRHPKIEHPEYLPTSGKYGACSVEYKIVVASGGIRMDETIFKKMNNPDDVLFQKNSPIDLNKLQGRLAKHLGSGTEQELQFHQMRPSPYIGTSMAGPFNFDLTIPSKYLPNIQNEAAGPSRQSLVHSSQPAIPFNVSFDTPKIVVEGTPFSAYLRITSLVKDWEIKPPQIRLKVFKMKLHVRTISRASLQRADNDHKVLVFEDKNLDIPLSNVPLDVGQMFGLTLTGFGIVPSFSARLLERQYELQTEVKIDVAGKTFIVEFPMSGCINLVSRLVATGIPRQAAMTDDTISSTADLQKRVKLKYSYIGRLSQEDNGPLQSGSVKEAALAFSRLLTENGIQHELHKDATFKLLAYRPSAASGLNDRNFDARQDDREVIRNLMEQHFTLLQNPDALGVYSRYTDPIYRTDITIHIPCKSLGCNMEEHYASTLESY